MCHRSPNYRVRIHPLTYPHLLCAGALLSSPPLEFTAQANAIDTSVGTRTPDTTKTQYSTLTICTQEGSVPAVNGSRGKHKICQRRPYLQVQIPQGAGQRQLEANNTLGTQEGCRPVSVPAVNGSRGKYKICQRCPYVQVQISQGAGQRH